MSHLGFRNQLFGFNKLEVNLYLEKLQREYNEKEMELNRRLSDLEKELKEKSNQFNSLKADYDEVKSKLDYYSGKEAEIEKTSMSIATMYLVAKQNSEEMLSSAKATAEEISFLAKKQLQAADTAGDKLNEIKSALTKSAADFDGEVANITKKLDDVKLRLDADLSRLKGENTVEITDGGN